MFHQTRAGFSIFCCTVEIFRILLKAASICRSANRAFHQKDENGHTIMDHLITSVQLGSSPDSISMLKEFLRIKRNISSVKDNASPLIRLLTMGNAFNVTASPMKARKFSRKHKTKDLNKELEHNTKRPDNKIKKLKNRVCDKI